MKRKTVLITAAVGLTAYGLGRAVWKDRSQTEEKTVPDIVIPFEMFREDSVVTDQVNGRYIAEWVRSQPDTDGTICIVAYPTKEVLEKFNIIDCPDELDPESNLLQFLLDLENSQPVRARRISFCSVSDKLKDSFCGKEYFVLKDNQ